MTFIFIFWYERKSLERDQPTNFWPVFLYTFNKEMNRYTGEQWLDVKAHHHTTPWYSYILYFIHKFKWIFDTIFTRKRLRKNIGNVFSEIISCTIDTRYNWSTLLYMYNCYVLRIQVLKKFVGSRWGDIRVWNGNLGKNRKFHLFDKGWFLGSK